MFMIGRKCISILLPDTVPVLHIESNLTLYKSKNKGGSEDNAAILL